MKKFAKGVSAAVRSICIVDRFLMLFMLILLSYTIFNLFTGRYSSGETNTIDVIVRTSVAAIFGYFISSNFIKSDSSVDSGFADGTGTDIASSPSGTDFYTPAQSYNPVQNQIGFQVPASPTVREVGKISLSSDASSTSKGCNKIQVVIVAIIGLICLSTLFVTRYFQVVTPELTAVISQLRDLVSACIGFLVSCGKSSSR